MATLKEMYDKGIFHKSVVHYLTRIISKAISNEPLTREDRRGYFTAKEYLFHQAAKAFNNLDPEKHEKDITLCLRESLSAGKARLAI